MTTTTIEVYQDTTSSSANLTEIYQEDVHKTLRIIYRDGNVVEKTAEEIANDIHQLRIYKETEEKLKRSLEIQLSQLSKRLMEWCKVNSSNLFMACCVPVKNYSRIFFIVVQNSNAYNEEFSRNLTRLEIEVEDSEKFCHINMKVMELPMMSEADIYNFVHNYTSNN